MRYSIFLSYPCPINNEQEKFISKLKGDLQSRGLEPRTLGVNEYDMNEPLVAIRRLMLESYGLITVAFKRSIIKEGIIKPGTNNEKSVKNQWITSPYCHIEPAMAFQVGLPILIFREKDVIADGILEKGVIGTYLPEFDLENNIEQYFESDEYKQIISKWDGYVKSVIEYRGNPPKLY